MLPYVSVVSAGLRKLEIRGAAKLGRVYHKQLLADLLAKPSVSAISKIGFPSCQLALELTSVDDYLELELELALESALELHLGRNWKHPQVVGKLTL